MQSSEGQLAALTKHQRQLMPYLSPEGEKSVQEEHDSLNTTWRRLGESVISRTELLSQVLLQRQEFHDRWNNFEKWITRVQKRLDAFREVYSDEVTDAGHKLEVSTRHFFMNPTSATLISQSRVC